MELLAVIVILAVIALIAVPTILNIIEKSRKESAILSAMSYIKGVETYILTSELDNRLEKLDGNQVYHTDKLNNLVELKGVKPISGMVKVSEKQEVEEATLNIDGYVIIYDGVDYKIDKINIGSFICKRAETLHTIPCESEDNLGCQANKKLVGEKITYGKLGTHGLLQAGDAFDCDVNGDGIYDSIKERFYYVADLDTDDSYAVFIYYSNVKQAQTTTIDDYAYHKDNSNFKGPVSILEQLPTISQWKNVSLSNTTRQIKAENNTVSTLGGQIKPFDYHNKAVRLLTYQEVKSACPEALEMDGSMNDCDYFLENTRYDNRNYTHGYWTETPYSLNSYYVWHVAGDFRNLHYNGSANFATYRGIRPAIEVLKSEILY